jgi:hypothetical protein
MTLARNGRGRPDAERHDQAHGGGRRGATARGVKLGRLAHDVVGGEHQHDCVRIAPRSQRGRDRDRRTGIAPRGLQHDVSLDADLAQLLRDDEAEVAIGDDDRAVEQVRIADAGKRLLECRAVADQRHELLGHRLARYRPQPRSRAAAHDHRCQPLACHPFEALVPKSLRIIDGAGIHNHRGRAPGSKYTRLMKGAS